MNTCRLTTHTQLLGLFYDCSPDKQMCKQMQTGPENIRLPVLPVESITALKSITGVTPHNVFSQLL